MILALLAYLAGVLTIVSPCILPVLPFVFARADRPFMTSGLPLLAGMAVTFAALGVLCALGGPGGGSCHEYARYAALIVMALFGLALLVPTLSDMMTRPLVSLGAKLSESAERKPHVGSTVLLGVATGLLWAPCAGPVLGLILTGAALNGASAQTAV